MKLYFIECRTGCTCCSGDNHYRGPYRSEEDAANRISFFRTSEGDHAFWPVASQYSRRGDYRVVEYEVEEISGGRAIVNDRVFYLKTLRPIEVRPDGSVADNDAERFYGLD